MSIRFAEMHTIFHLAGWIQSRFYLLSSIYYFPLTTFWQGRKDLKSKLFRQKYPPTFKNSSIFTFPMKSTHFHFSFIGIHPHDAKSWDEETYSELKDAARWKQYFWQNKRRFSPRTMSAPGSLLLILSGAPYMYNHIWPSQLCEDIGDDLNTHHLCETSGAPNVLLSGSVASTSTGIFRLRKSRLRSLRNRWFWSGWWL